MQGAHEDVARRVGGGDLGPDGLESRVILAKVDFVFPLGISADFKIGIKPDPDVRGAVDREAPLERSPDGQAGQDPEL